MKNCLFFQSLTNGSGFFLSDAREMVGEGRHVVLRHRETGEFIDDFTNKGKRKNSKEHLCLKDRKITHWTVTMPVIIVRFARLAVVIACFAILTIHVYQNKILKQICSVRIFTVLHQCIKLVYFD